MRIILAAALTCIVLAIAAAETNTSQNTGSRTTQQVAYNPDPELVTQAGIQLFYEICIATGAQLASVSEAHNAQITNEMPSDIVELGVSNLGLEDFFDNVQLGERSFRSEILTSFIPSEEEYIVFFDSLYGSVDLLGQPGHLTFCSIGFAGVPADHLVESIEEWLQRPPHSEKNVNVSNGGKTRWVIWNTIGSPEGIAVVAVVIPEEGREFPGPLLLASARQ